jgi:hypothetical protein
MLTHYILTANGAPIVEPNIHAWAQWFETAKLEIAFDTVGKSAITTRFLGVAFDPDCPHVWETKIIGGTLDQVTDRCPGTIEDAQAMHDSMVQRVRSQEAIS